MKHLPLLAAAIGLAATVGLSVTPARATGIQVYSTFGPSKSFNKSAGYCVNALSGYCDPGNSILIAVSFTSPTSAPLDYIDVGVTNYGTPSGGDKALGATFALVADDSGIPSESGPALEEWVVAKLPDYGAATVHATLLTSKVHPTIQAGVKYWIVMFPGGYDSSTAWMYNTIGISGGLAGDTDSGGWATFGSDATPAFDVWLQ